MVQQCLAANKRQCKLNLCKRGEGKSGAKWRIYADWIYIGLYLLYINLQNDEGAEGEGVGDDEEGGDIEVSFTLSWRWISF